MKITESFADHFLIAMPALQDTFFSKSVIYLYEHSSKGAMGIVINKPLQVTLESLLQHLDINVLDEEIANLPVLAGGPVGPEQGFVIHGRDMKKTMKNERTIVVSSSKKILSLISQRQGPDSFIIALGYSGWQKGQLENEIARNDWLIAPIDHDVIFKTPLEKRWEKAAEVLGININQLSDQVGHD